MSHPVYGRTAAAEQRAFLLVFGLVLPLALVALASALQASGLDARLSSALYDASTQRFFLSSEGWADLLGHRVGKSLVLAAWALLAGAALASPWIPVFKPHRRLLWTLVAAMGLGPALVAVLKDMNTHACPWNLKEYGGTADYSARWFVSRLEAGRCFPGGHAAGGFSLVAIAFAGQVLQRPGLRRAGLWLGFGVGAVFSLLRVAQGAHFMSHNLWAAAVDLWITALVFAPLLWVGRRMAAAEGHAPLSGLAS